MIMDTNRYSLLKSNSSEHFNKHIQSHIMLQYILTSDWMVYNKSEKKRKKCIKCAINMHAKL